MLYTIILIVHVFISLGLVGLVLLQHGKGADAGAAFGSGASGTVFGSQGSSNFLSHSTAVLAALFFFTSLGLAYMSRDLISAPDSVLERAAQSDEAQSDMPSVMPLTEKTVDDAEAASVMPESSDAAAMPEEPVENSAENPAENKEQTGKTAPPPSETESK